jgi:beta-glucosidase
MGSKRSKIVAMGIACALALAARASENSADQVPVVSGPKVWKDPSQAPEARARDLVRRLSLTEKCSQILANTPAIARLGIPAYSHRNECLHGVAYNNATVFPQAIGMAATWDLPLIHEEAEVIATEGRAKHNDYVAKHDGNTGEHTGVNFYSPNINIFRDPRWGRGQETYGEDPFLTARFGVAFITGLQGDDPAHPKAIACAKHFAVHSGPEKQRHFFDSCPPEKDLYDTYLPAFEAAVREGHVGSVMGAYSSVYGEPCCANPFLLTDLLRKQWGFDGVVFSDGGAIGDIWAEHKYVPTPEAAAAEAVMAGCDVSSGGMDQKPAPRGATGPGHANNGIKGGWAFSALPDAVQSGLIKEDAVNTAVVRELTLRFRLGLFDPSTEPYAKIAIDQNDTPEHRALSLKVAQESLVLLKNDGLLPLDRAKIKRIAVIGPNADSIRMQNGNYAGKPSSSTSILQGIKDAVGSQIEVTYQRGCPLALLKNNSNAPGPQMAADAAEAAKSADVVIFVGGLDQTLEKEEGPAAADNHQGFSRGDRLNIELPPLQEELIKSLAATGKPVVFVNCSGSAIAMPWENEHVPAILQAWYPGEEGGRAVAQALFGEINPGGRLPITFYASTSDLPSFDDYSMAHRTYRYFEGKPLFAFGHGLSYTKFEYADAKVGASSVSASDHIDLSFAVKNTGGRDGDEVPQVYFRHVNAAQQEPRMALCGFTREHVSAGQSKQVSMQIPVERFRSWDEKAQHYVVEPGQYDLMIGGASDETPLKTTLNVSGK